MNKKSDSENQVAKMQKLRRAVERIRRVQGPQQQSAERRSWFKRVLERLGLSSNSDTEA